LTVGCATESQNKQNLAIAAGVKVITPTKPDLQTLPADKGKRNQSVESVKISGPQDRAASAGRSAESKKSPRRNRGDNRGNARERAATNTLVP
jgi:hypothetical protein